MNDTVKNYPSTFRAALIAGCVLACFSAAAYCQSSWIDSVAAVYDSAARNYDSMLLVDAAETIMHRPASDRQSHRAQLTLGLICWRLELIGFCVDDRVRVIRYGEMAIAALDKAEKAGADRYLAASHKALASQLMAAQGAAKGMVYGPRSAREVKKAKEENPNGYFSRFTEAVNASQAPKLAGGNPKKAIVAFEKMMKGFPDSIDVRIHLALAYSNTNRTEDARALILPVITAYPKNLFARKVAAEAGVR